MRRSCCLTARWARSLPLVGSVGALYRTRRPSLGSAPTWFYVGASCYVTPAFIVEGEVFLIVNPEHDTRAALASFRATYQLSKRTAVYAQAAYLANSAKPHYSVSAGGGTTPGAGVGQTGAMLGVKHLF